MMHAVLQYFSASRRSAAHKETVDVEFVYATTTSYAADHTVNCAL